MSLCLEERFDWMTILPNNWDQVLSAEELAEPPQSFDSAFASQLSSFAPRRSCRVALADSSPWQDAMSSNYSVKPSVPRRTLTSWVEHTYRKCRPMTKTNGSSTFRARKGRGFRVAPYGLSGGTLTNESHAPTKDCGRRTLRSAQF